MVISCHTYDYMYIATASPDAPTKVIKACISLNSVFFIYKKNIYIHACFTFCVYNLTIE